MMSLRSMRDTLFKPNTRAFKILIVLAILGLSAASGYARTPLLLVALVGAAGLALLLQEPALSLVAMAGLSFTLPIELGTGSEVALTPPMMMIPAFVLVWVAEGLRERSWSLPTSRTNLPLLLFVAGGMISFLAGTVYWDPAVPRASNLVLVQLAQWAVFALSAAIYLLAGDLGQRGKWLQRATWLFVILGAIVVAENYVPVLHRLLGWSDSSRAKSGVFWAWLGALSVGQLLFNRHLRPLVKWALGLLLIAEAVVVLIWWRDWLSGWGPFVIALGVVAWMRVWRHSHRAAVIAVVAAVIVGLVIAPFVFEFAGGEEEKDYSWGGRLALYRAVIDLAKAHPLLGLGPAAYRHYGYTRNLYMGYGQAFYQAVWLSSHNNYIDIYAQFGLLGVALFLWFVVELGIEGWRLTDRFDGDFEDGYVHGALGGLVGSLAAMMLVDWFLPYVYNVGFRGFRTSALAWMFLGGLVALSHKPDGSS